MGSCKDCLHYKPCQVTYDHMLESCCGNFDSLHLADMHDCPEFTDCSEWLYMPNVSKTIWRKRK